MCTQSSAEAQSRSKSTEGHLPGRFRVSGVCVLNQNRFRQRRLIEKCKNSQNGRT